MAVSFKHMVVASFAAKAVTEILASSPEALRGVSIADAERLRQAFGITTVRAMAQNRFFQRAQSLLAASGIPDYDPGPPLAWQALFATAPVSHYVDHGSGRFRTAFGPVYYRGRLDGSARLLIIGQDPATDELLAFRAFVGSSGQRLQRFLHKIGISRSYVIVNTFLFGVFGQFDSTLRAISLEGPILEFRNSMLNRIAKDNRIEAIITIGAAARHAVEHWPGSATHSVFELVHPAAPENLVLPNWNQQLPVVHAALQPDDGAQVDLSSYGSQFTSSDEAPIPRFDLPFGIPAWHGTGGGRSRRDGSNKIIWTAP